MITIPKSQVNAVDTLAKVWPPMMQLRIRKPCRLKTFKRLGTIDPKDLPSFFQYQDCDNDGRREKSAQRTQKKIELGPSPLYRVSVQTAH